MDNIDTALAAVWRAEVEHERRAGEARRRGDNAEALKHKRQARALREALNLIEEEAL